MRMIDKVTKKIEAAVASAEKQVVRAKAEAAVLRQLAGLWPDLEIDKAHVHSAYAKACIELTVDTRTEAIAFLRGLTLERVGVERNGCTAIRPLRDEADHEIGRVVWEYDPSPISQPKATLRAWANSSMGNIEFRVRIAKDPAHTKERHHRGYGNRITRHRWVLYDGPHGELISWSSGDSKREGRKTILFAPENIDGGESYEEQLYCENENIQPGARP